MSERDGYEPGVPCWVDSRQPDPRAALDFYTQLFGWEAEASGEYAFCRLRGRDVAAITAGEAPAWSTHIWVESADETAARVQDAGGRVVTAPFDLPGAGRTAVLADPAGAAFSVWQPDGHKGAQRVNEPGAWAMSSLSTPDLDGAKAFYGTVFGWETDTFSVGEISVTLDAAAERAAELGGTAIVAPFDIPIGRTAVLADPQGATFSISRVVPA